MLKQCFCHSEGYLLRTGSCMVVDWALLGCALDHEATNMEKAHTKSHDPGLNVLWTIHLQKS